jgi:hypothetical protein
MHGLSIHDGTRDDPTLSPRPEVGCLDFDLVDVLRALGPQAERSAWRCGDVDCFGVTAGALDQAIAAGGRISGEQLLAFAAGLTQVIDGTFEGFDLGATAPWVVITAVDSSWWEVRSSDDAALAAIRERFRATRALPERAT